MAEACSGSCSSCSKQDCDSRKSSMLEPLNASSKIGKVIGVVSGKGGVGKSLVTASIAVELAAKGYKVGILDADITGPSIPKMFGLTQRAAGTEEGIIPEVTDKGIKVMSINLLLENPEAPVIWRGPVIAGVVKQFWTDVVWGELDYLVIDMPPGTGDVPLTVFQSIPTDGIVIVTSPQDLVKMIVAKAYNMAGMMNIPVLGLVENYSYLECPDCGKRISVFGESQVEEVGAEMGIPVLGQIPILPTIAATVDMGMFGSARMPYVEKAVAAVEAIVK